MLKVLGYGTSHVSRRVWHVDNLSEGLDMVATETALALVYNGVSHAVMMGTPNDLEDFALGFSLSEGILKDPKQLLDYEAVETEKGIELSMTIASEPFARLKQRRRSLVGRTGCGICGAESLEVAVREPSALEDSKRAGLGMLTHTAIQKAADELPSLQTLQQETGAVHGSALCTPNGEIIMVREDVGRHNALDKLIGALARLEAKKGERMVTGFVITTSRASYEMVQKTVTAGIGTLAAVSAPTSLAVDLAKKAGLTLIGFLRRDRHVVYANDWRIKMGDQRANGCINAKKFG
jgi:FdhD protein